MIASLRSSSRDLAGAARKQGMSHTLGLDLMYQEACIGHGLVAASSRLHFYSRLAFMETALNTLKPFVRHEHDVPCTTMYARRVCTQQRQQEHTRTARQSAEGGETLVAWTGRSPVTRRCVRHQHAHEFHTPPALRREESADPTRSPESPLPPSSAQQWRQEGVRKLNKWLAHKRNPFKFGGVFHAGLEVHGLEWSFGMSLSDSVPGVECSLPRRVRSLARGVWAAFVCLRHSGVICVSVKSFRGTPGFTVSVMPFVNISAVTAIFQLSTIRRFRLPIYSCFQLQGLPESPGSQTCSDAEDYLALVVLRMFKILPVSDTRRVS